MSRAGAEVGRIHEFTCERCGLTRLVNEGPWPSLPSLFDAFARLHRAGSPDCDADEEAFAGRELCTVEWSGRSGQKALRQKQHG